MDFSAEFAVFVRELQRPIGKRAFDGAAEFINIALDQEKWQDRFSFSPDRNRMNDFGNNLMGLMIGTSVGGTATGLGGDVCIGDDLLSQDDSFSETAKAATNRWLDSTWATKLNSPSQGVFVHISQRLAEDDPAGHLLETQPGKWVHLKIPLVCTEESEVYEFPGRG
jgi:hypothetical protein